MAKMFGALVVLCASTMTPPDSVTATPARSRPSPLVCGARPMAKKTRSLSKCRPFGQMQAFAAIGIFQFVQQHAGMHANALRVQRVRERLAQIVIETAQGQALAE